MRRSTSSSTDEPGSPSREQQIRAFLISASKTGAYIADVKERRVAQSILDFWSAELAASSKGSSDDFESALLAPFDATQIADEADKATTASIKDDQRALIRLSAMARQWRDSDKRSGYLLTGETIEEAARFKYQNPNLAEFVKASEDAERAKRRRKRNTIYAGLTVSAMLGSITTLFVSQFYAAVTSTRTLAPIAGFGTHDIALNSGDAIALARVVREEIKAKRSIDAEVASGFVAILSRLSQANQLEILVAVLKYPNATGDERRAIINAIGALKDGQTSDDLADIWPIVDWLKSQPGVDVFALPQRSAAAS